MTTMISSKEKLLFNNIHDYISKYLKKQEIPEHIITKISEPLHLKYFTYYPYLFNDAFDFYDEEKLEKLSAAGFLYYKSVLLIDNIFDKDDKEKSFDHYMIANICQEESIKLLSSIFPYDSKFWKLWNLRKSEYTKAYQIDKVSHDITSFEEYQILCDYKCAFGKIALDSLFFLAGKQYHNTYSKILESFKYFYTAFQISDDLTDYEEDLEGNQFNIARYQLQKKLSESDNSIENYSVLEQKKLVYTTEVSSDLHQKALKSLETARIKLTGITASLWEKENEKLQALLQSNYLNIDGYLRVFKTKKTLSNHNITNNTLDKAINLGSEFIKKEQEKNGCWHDYFNDAGTSNVWTTGFITAILSQKNKVRSSSLTSNFKNSIDFIDKSINSDCAWGYNDVWMSDADSTTLALLAMHINGKEISDKSISEWFSYQNADGGFSTYRYKDKTRLLVTVNEKDADIKGWTNSHFCVSAVAYYFLSCLGSDNKFLNEKNELKNYILQKLKNKEEHYSYWWTSFCYVVSFLIKGSVHDGDKNILSESLIILDEILKDNNKLNTIINSNFYQGLLLDALCSSKELYTTYQNTIQQIKDNIIKNQYTDGSWASSYCLRIPHISTTHPDEKQLWKKNATGANNLINDYHRLFSTSVCLSGLSKYETINKQADIQKQVIV